MIHGEAGIMAISRPEFKPVHIESRRLLQWPNGVIATTYSGEKPDQLRGPAHGAAWGDEPAKWKYGQDAIDNLMFGLRLGQHPQVCFTTTPRPIKLIKELVKDPTTHPTRGTTYENLKNLAPAFAKKIISKYEGTRLGRQELNAEILDDVPGALWNRTNIDSNRVKTCPDMRRIVVAIDPNVTSGEDADEAGIVVCGLGVDGLGYVLEDATGDDVGEARGPAGWAKRAVAAYKKWQADRIVGEVNNGGEMVGMVIRAVDSIVSYKAVHATRGKVVRAEPISALYEQDRIKHVGVFPQLEDQMCVPGDTLVEIHRGQVPIRDIQVGDLAMTRFGLFPIKTMRETGCSSEFIVIDSINERRVQCTTTHPIWVSGRFVPAKNVRVGESLQGSHKWVSTDHPSHGAANGIIECGRGITDMLREFFCTAPFGERISGRFLKDFMSITLMEIRVTMSQLIWNFCQQNSITACTNLAGLGILAQKSGAYTLNRRGNSAHGLNLSAYLAGKLGQHHIQIDENSVMAPVRLVTNHYRKSQRERVISAVKNFQQEIQGELTAVKNVTVQHTEPKSVYNLQIDGPPEYFANGLLVHNCEFTHDFSKEKAGYSPDRMEALVWGFTELGLTEETGWDWS